MGFLSKNVLFWHPENTPENRCFSHFLAAQSLGFALIAPATARNVQKVVFDVNTGNPLLIEVYCKKLGNPGGSKLQKG